MWMYALRSVWALAVRAWLRIYHRLRITGREHLPRTGSFVLVCNHTSHLDTLCLLSCLPLRRLHRTFPAAASDYFFSSVPRSFLSAILINALPFDRELNGAESLGVCAELLRGDGNVLILFPEGTRATTGKMGRFRSGIGRLLAGQDLTVVPCHLSGGAEAFPKSAVFPRPRKLRLTIGTPRRYADRSPEAASVKAICEELQDCVARLGEHTA
jgi:1-acyl-sn-glycerol-3-phosphate acyltransferase